MPVEEPGWWYGPANATIVRLLRPLAALYANRATQREQRRAPYRSRLPVICVGNFTAGGTGKTPLTLHILGRLVDMGERPAVLTRGYGGRTRGPHWVDPSSDTARDVGDEPLLLVRSAPTLIARDRRAGAIAIETAADDFTCIVMDDGLQNPALAKDLTFAVLDQKRGIGNGEVIPAGPLRAPLDVQLPLTDAIVVNAPAQTSQQTAPSHEPATNDHLAALRQSFPGPVLAASAQATGEVSWLAERPVIAYAGIANPQRFFALVEQCGGRIAERVAFKDHHAFSEADARKLISRADAHAAALVTTEKDLVRLGGTPTLQVLRERTRALAITLVFAQGDQSRCDALLAGTLSSGGYRSGREAG